MGGFGDKEKAAELINISNQMSQRILSKDSVKIGKEWSGTLSLGLYGKNKLQVRLNNSIIVKNGIADEDLFLEARFKWTQSRIDQEIAKGGQIFIKNINSLRPTMLRHYETDIIRAPTTLLTKELDGTPTNTDGNAELKDLFGIPPFEYPKPTKLLQYLFRTITVQWKRNHSGFFRRIWHYCPSCDAIE